MKMAAARPQSVFLSDNTSCAPTLAFAQNVCVAGWTTVGDGTGRTKGSGTYIIHDCVITTKEMRLCLCRWWCLYLIWLTGKNNAYFETVLGI